MRTAPVQLSDPASPNVVIEIVRSPATVLASIALLVRWVIAPAVATFNRRDLRPELEQLALVAAAHPRLDERLQRLERALELLAEMPESIARLEEQVRTALKIRREG